MNDQDLTEPKVWRKHRIRQVLLFVTIPGVLLGAAVYKTVEVRAAREHLSAAGAADSVARALGADGQRGGVDHPR